MRQAVEGTYDLTVPGDTSPRATFTLRFGNGDLSHRPASPLQQPDVRGLGQRLQPVDAR